MIAEEQREAEERRSQRSREQRRNAEFFFTVET